MSNTPVDIARIFDKSSPASGGSSSWTTLQATLLAGYPISIPTGATDLTNSDCTVISDGVTPILLFAQVGLANSGANVGKVVLSIREGATVILSSPEQDVAITSGNSSLDLSGSVVLSKGTHNLKLTAHKVGANGTVTATANGGDLNDTYLQAIQRTTVGGGSGSWTPITGGPGVVWQGADQAPHLRAGLYENDVVNAKAVPGSKLIHQTWDRSILWGVIPSSFAVTTGIFSAGVFYCVEDAVLATAWSWYSPAIVWGASTARVCKVGIYGPITVANAAVVPLLFGSISTEAALQTAGYAKGTPWAMGNTQLLGGNLYALGIHVSWTGALTTTPNFFIPNNSGVISGVNDPAQGSPNLGTLASSQFSSGLVDLPATIDLSASRVVASGGKLPLLIAATA